MIKNRFCSLSRYHKINDNSLTNQCYKSKINSMTKLQLSLTKQEVDILSTKASQLGYSVTRYVKFLISREASQSLDPFENLPTFPMSKVLEDKGLKALADHRAGNTIEFDSIEELFEEV